MPRFGDLHGLPTGELKDFSANKSSLVSERGSCISYYNEPDVEKARPGFQMERFADDEQRHELIAVKLSGYMYDVTSRDRIQVVSSSNDLANLLSPEASFESDPSHPESPQESQSDSSDGNYRGSDIGFDLTDSIVIGPFAGQEAWANISREEPQLLLPTSPRAVTASGSSGNGLRGSFASDGSTANCSSASSEKHETTTERFSNIYNSGTLQTRFGDLTISDSDSLDSVKLRVQQPGKSEVYQPIEGRFERYDLPGIQSLSPGDRSTQKPRSKGKGKATSKQYGLDKSKSSSQKKRPINKIKPLDDDDNDKDSSSDSERECSNDGEAENTHEDWHCVLGKICPNCFPECNRRSFPEPSKVKYHLIRDHHLKIFGKTKEERKKNRKLSDERQWDRLFRRIRDRFGLDIPHPETRHFNPLETFMSVNKFAIDHVPTFLARAYNTRVSEYPNYPQQILVWDCFWETWNWMLAMAPTICTCQGLRAKIDAELARLNPTLEENTEELDPSTHHIATQLGQDEGPDFASDWSNGEESSHARQGWERSQLRGLN